MQTRPERWCSVLMAGAALLAICADGAFAQTTAAIDAGQIRLIDAKNIRLDWQDLYLSPDEVRVSYQFTNAGTEDMVSLAAFPLAPIDLESGMDYAVAASGNRDIVDLEISVDGVSVTPVIEVRAVREGRDITDLLEKYRIPLIPFAATGNRGWQPYFHSIAALDAEGREALESVGALLFDDPQWVAQVVYHWKMRFPPGQPVEMTYRYTPVPGTAPFSRASLKQEGTVKQYCIDRDFAAAVTKRLAPRGSGAPEALGASYLNYILTGPTGWSNPIGRFYLTVDKGKADTLLSLCASGVHRIGETTVRMERFDYVPDENLRILFIRDLDTR